MGGNLAAEVGRGLRVWIQMHHKNENSMLDHEVQLAVLCSTNQSMSLLLLLSEQAGLFAGLSLCVVVINIGLIITELTGTTSMSKFLCLCNFVSTNNKQI